MDFLSPNLAFIEGLGGPEMVLILVIVLVLFGGDKLPDFARGLGKSIREFKKAATGVEEEFKRALEEDAQKKSTPPTTLPEPVIPIESAPVNQIEPPAVSHVEPSVSTPLALETPPATDPHATASVAPDVTVVPPATPPPKTEPPASPHTEHLP